MKLCPLIWCECTLGGGGGGKKKTFTKKETTQNKRSRERVRRRKVTTAMVATERKVGLSKSGCSVRIHPYRSIFIFEVASAYAFFLLNYISICTLERLRRGYYLKHRCILSTHHMRLLTYHMHPDTIIPSTVYVRSRRASEGASRIANSHLRHASPARFLR